MTCTTQHGQGKHLFIIQIKGHRESTQRGRHKLSTLQILYAYNRQETFYDTIRCNTKLSTLRSILHTVWYSSLVLVLNVILKMNIVFCKLLRFTRKILKKNHLPISYFKRKQIILKMYKTSALAIYLNSANSADSFDQEETVQSLLR